MEWNDFLEFAPWVAIAAVIAHGFIRQFWIAYGVAAFGCSLLNVAVEIVQHDFRIRPSDVGFWLPMLFFHGAALAAPVAFLAGLPFFFFRRRRKPQCSEFAAPLRTAINAPPDLPSPAAVVKVRAHRSQLKAPT